MGIFDLLSTKEVNRDCEVNGYLEDYLETMEDSQIKETFKSLCELNHSIKVVVNLKESVCKESISNSIIRYKDIFKLENEGVIIPYVLYFRNDEEDRALLLTKEEYIYAKGMYLSLSEENTELNKFKNNVVALSLDRPELVVETFSKMFTEKAGRIQRDLDKKYYETYDKAFEKAVMISDEIGDTFVERSKEVSSKEAYVKSCVSKWFVLKKFVYVQYMVDKNILNKVHQGNIKLQRNQAKINADSIRFIPISQMWQLIKENQ